MPDPDHDLLRRLFDKALDLPPSVRRPFLESKCGQDEDLKRRLLAMLAAAEHGQFLAEPIGPVPAPPAAAASAASPPPVAAIRGEAPGDRIGPYHLLQELGEGGFGVVWLAERREPMVQRVAIKVIKPGMDSKAVVARFEQERQALAVMDHQNVARVFDGGITPAGRPFFVMEYVQGEPITAFADRRRLTLRQRLELFLPVCEAVQHAHMKGIIHRDLKPGNVLVTDPEGRPVPKVIDFGIAKATDASAVQHSVFSVEGQIIGTPEYMSPEQFAGELDVDTRTDVYSLGVMLYELLTGELPFDSRELRRAALVEIARIIRDVTPPKPSTRLAQLGEARWTAAAQARSDSRARLTGELRRDLDWIPLMALRKERERRYASPEAMADDVRRYLAGQPLRAAPESRAYLARKFVKRNKVQVLAAAAVFLALGAGLAIAIWQRSAALDAQRAEAVQRAAAEQQRNRADERALAAEAAQQQERERADQLKQVADFQSQMLNGIDPNKAGAELMADVCERFGAALAKAGVPDAERAVQVDALQQELVRVNATDLAAAMIDRTILQPAIKTIDARFHNDPRTDASLRQALAHVYRTIGLNGLALPLQESALATRRRVLGAEHPETFLSVNDMGVLLKAQGKFAQAEPYLREAVDTCRRVLGEDHPDTLAAISNLASLLQSQGKLAEAEPLLREVLEARRRVRGEDHPETLTSLNELGGLLHYLGRLDEAESCLRDLVDRRRRVQGEEHLDTLNAIHNMGFLLQSLGKLAAAEPFMRESMEKHRRVLGEEHPNTLQSINSMGSLLKAQGKFAEAEPYQRELVAKSRRVLGEDHPFTLIAIGNMGHLLQEQGKLKEAESYVRESVAKSRRILGPEHASTLLCICNLGSLLQAQGKLAEAEPCFLEALDTRRRVLGEDHPETIISIAWMGELLRAQGRLDEAERYHREAVAKSRRIHGEQHPTTLVFTTILGRVLQLQGKYLAAIEVLEPAVSPARSAFTGGNGPRLAGLLMTLAQARKGLGFEAQRYALAAADLQEAHSLYATGLGEEHRDTLGCVRGLAELYAAWDQAEPGSGHDAKAAEWRARLDAANEASPKDQGAQKK